MDRFLKKEQSFQANRFAIWMFCLTLLVSSSQTQSTTNSKSIFKDNFIHEFSSLFDNRIFTKKNGVFSSKKMHLQTTTSSLAPIIAGVVTNAEYPACTDNTSRICNEANNNLGSGICGREEDCFYGRTCNITGFCVGKPNFNYIVKSAMTGSEVTADNTLINQNVGSLAPKTEGSDTLLKEAAEKSNQEAVEKLNQEALAANNTLNTKTVVIQPEIVDSSLGQNKSNINVQTVEKETIVQDLSSSSQGDLNQIESSTSVVENKPQTIIVGSQNLANNVPSDDELVVHAIDDLINNVNATNYNDSLQKIGILLNNSTVLNETQKESFYNQLSKISEKVQESQKVVVVTNNETVKANVVGVNNQNGTSNVVINNSAVAVASNNSGFLTVGEVVSQNGSVNQQENVVGNSSVQQVDSQSELKNEQVKPVITSAVQQVDSQDVLNNEQVKPIVTTNSVEQVESQDVINIQKVKPVITTSVQQVDNEGVLINEQAKPIITSTVQQVDNEGVLNNQQVKSVVTSSVQQVKPVVTSTVQQVDSQIVLNNEQVKPIVTNTVQSVENQNALNNEQSKPIITNSIQPVINQSESTNQQITTSLNDSTDIKCLSEFVSTLPQFPSFLESGILSSTDPIANITTAIDPTGLFSGAKNFSLSDYDPEELNQTQMFTTPEISIVGVHPPEESEAYLQVLNAMYRKPQTVEISGHNGLNLAVLKVLQVTDQFTGKANNAVSSNTVLINDLIENLSTFAFTQSASPLKTAIPELQELVNGKITHLLTLYKNQVLLKNGEKLFDNDQTDILQKFETRVNCMYEKDCDFSQINDNDQSKTTSDRKLQTQIDATMTNYSDSDSLMQFIRKFAEDLPVSNSDIEIKANTSPFIAQVQADLTESDKEFPALNAKFQNKLSNLKQNLPIYEKLTIPQFQTILANWNKQTQLKIDSEFTQQRINLRAQYLIELKTKVGNTLNILGKSTPVDSVLVENLQKLSNNLQEHINVFSNVQKASEKQMANAREYLKDDFSLNIQKVDQPKSIALIQSISSKTGSILRSNFGKSLNYDNLNFIIHKSIGALSQDFDLMKNSSKASGFMLNNTNLQWLNGNISQVLNKGRDNKETSHLDLSDFKREIEYLNKKLVFRAESRDNARNAADLMILYENVIYDTLSNEAFYDQLHGYIGKYYNVYHGHASLLRPFFEYSNVYKTLTSGLNNPNALLVAKPNPVRNLHESIGKVIKNQDLLTKEDMRFFNMVHHLLSEVHVKGDLSAVNNKLEDIILTLTDKNESPKHYCFCDLDSSSNDNVSKPKGVSMRMLVDLAKRGLDNIGSETKDLKEKLMIGRKEVGVLSDGLMESDVKVEFKPRETLFGRLLGLKDVGMIKGGSVETTLGESLRKNVEDSEREIHLLEMSVEETKLMMNELMTSL